MRLVLYTGKGGVGKTTTAAATAAHAAVLGRRTLVVSADAAHSLGDVLERRLASPGDGPPRPVAVADGLDALEVDVRREVDRHWGRIRDWLVALLRHQGIEDVVAEELALVPGAEELVTLLAVEEHARRGRYDLVIVDCAPTDATLRLVTLPEVASGTLRLLLRMQQALSRVVTPMARAWMRTPLPDAGVFAEADRLLYEKLSRLRRRMTAPGTHVRMVVTPERMVIDEARRAWTDLSLFDVRCDAVVMNRLLPEEALAEPFFQEWAPLQAERLAEVESLFAPLPVLRAPLGPDEVTGLERLAAHGAVLFAGRDPAARLGRPPRLRFSRTRGGYRLRLPLPEARAAELGVTKVEGDLVVRTGSHRRALVLPRRVASLTLRDARLRKGALEVRFTGDETAG